MKSFWFKDVFYRQIVKVPDQAAALAAVKPGVIAVIMPGSKPKSLKLFCPCGCGEMLSINLMPQVAKAWRLWGNAGLGLSLWPSVWLDLGCKSHFILHNNTARLLYGKMPEMTEEEVDRWWKLPE
jgi:hypothetical protein